MRRGVAHNGTVNRRLPAGARRYPRGTGSRPSRQPENDSGFLAEAAGRDLRAGAMGGGSGEQTVLMAAAAGWDGSMTFRPARWPASRTRRSRIPSAATKRTSPWGTRLGCFGCSRRRCPRIPGRGCLDPRNRRTLRGVGASRHRPGASFDDRNDKARVRSNLRIQVSGGRRTFKLGRSERLDRVQRFREVQCHAFLRNAELDAPVLPSRRVRGAPQWRRRPVVQRQRHDVAHGGRGHPANRGGSERVRIDRGLGRRP